jgi:hypothetical protein
MSEQQREWMLGHFFLPQRCRRPPNSSSIHLHVPMSGPVHTRWCFRLASRTRYSASSTENECWAFLPSAIVSTFQINHPSTSTYLCLAQYSSWFPVGFACYSVAFVFFWRDFAKKWN